MIHDQLQSLEIRSADRRDTEAMMGIRLAVTENRMSRKQAADNYLRNITTDMNVIENHTYYKACLFYKGLISEGEAIAENDDDPLASGRDSFIRNFEIMFCSHWIHVRLERDFHVECNKD